jgi:hypothetical protein
LVPEGKRICVTLAASWVKSRENTRQNQAFPKLKVNPLELLPGASDIGLQFKDEEK